MDLESNGRGYPPIDTGGGEVMLLEIMGVVVHNVQH